MPVSNAMSDADSCTVVYLCISRRDVMIIHLAGYAAVVTLAGY